MELKIQHSTNRDGLVRDRIKAVTHVSNGWSPEEIADVLLIHESTARQHIKATCNRASSSPKMALQGLQL